MSECNARHPKLIPSRCRTRTGHTSRKTTRSLICEAFKLGFDIISPILAFTGNDGDTVWHKTRVFAPYGVVATPQLNIDACSKFELDLRNRGCQRSAFPGSASTSLSGVP
jgi:hypothetical protein